MTRPSLLIAGIGNIFFGDDAFGSEVARKLAQRPQPEEVRVVDFGIRGIDLVYSLLEGYPTVILIDAVRRGGKPGTVFLIEPDIASLKPPDGSQISIDAHGMEIEKVLRTALGMGARLDRVLLVGCEPAVIGEDDMRMEMSDLVQAAVHEAVEMIESLVKNIMEDQRKAGGAGARSEGPSAAPKELQS